MRVLIVGERVGHIDVDASNRTYVADSAVGLAIFARGASTPATVLTNPVIRAPGAVAVAPPFEITSGTLARAALGRAGSSD